VRHDGGTEDAGGQQHAVGALEPRHQAGHCRSRIGVGREQVRRERQDDHTESHRDGDLEGAESARPQREHGEREGADDEPAGQQWDAEEQVQGDRAADHLGQVGGHGDQLGLHPHHPVHRPGQPLPAQLGQAAPGGQTQLRGECLHQHRHQVGHDHDPDQQVAVAGAGGGVGGEVARVDVRHGGDERGAEQDQPAAYPPTCAGHL
jgi:hypothetical protein